MNVKISSISSYSVYSTKLNGPKYYYRSLTIQLNVSRLFYTQLNVKAFLFHTIQFSIWRQFSHVWTIDRTLSGATTPGQSGPGSDVNEGVLCIPQSSSFTGASRSDCLAPYPSFTLLHRCNQCIPQLQLNGPQMIVVLTLLVTTLDFSSRFTLESPGGNTPQDTNCTATCPLSRKLFKLDEPDMQDTAGEAEMNS